MSNILKIRIFTLLICNIFMITVFCKAGQDIFEEVFNSYLTHFQPYCITCCRRNEYLTLLELVRGTLGILEIEAHF
jgi:hypothetical protein